MPRTTHVDYLLRFVIELRVSEETLDEMLAWVESGERPDRQVMERLGVYASGAVTDQMVPDGWVRIRLRS